MSSGPQEQETMLNKFLLNFYAQHKNIKNTSNKQLAKEIFLDQMKSTKLPSRLGYIRFKKHYFEQFNNPLYQAYLSHKMGRKRANPYPNNTTTMKRHRI